MHLPFTLQYLAKSLTEFYKEINIFLNQQTKVHNVYILVAHMTSGCYLASDVGNLE